MNSLPRRAFLRTLAGSAVSLYGITRAPAAPSPDAPPQVALGKTGITLSRVGQGTGMSGGRRQSNHTRMGFEKLVALLRHDYDRGITFFDMADLYGTHIYFREALRSIPRDKVAILTKLWWRYDGEATDNPPALQKKLCNIALERFRHEIATDYLDVVLLHCLTSSQWDQELTGYMEALNEAKAKKQIRAVGVSCHELRALKLAAQSPWVDVILARINPKGAKMDAPTDQVVPVLRQAKANGKAIIGMKIYGEGSLASMKDDCIQFAQNLGLLDTMTVGAETPGQMDETLGLIAKYPAANA